MAPMAFRAALALLPLLVAPAAPSAQTCFAQPHPVSFIWLKDTVNATTGQKTPWLPARDAEDGSGDIVLEQREMWPNASEMHAPTEDADAREILDRLRELAAQPLDRLDAAVIIPSVPGYGVGSTISALIYPLLETLATSARRRRAAFALVVRVLILPSSLPSPPRRRR